MLLEASDPVPQGLKIFIVERKSANGFIKIHRMPEALFRLFRAARDARITGEIEGNQVTLGCNFCARSRMASAFSMLSVRLSA